MGNRPAHVRRRLTSAASALGAALFLVAADATELKIAHFMSPKHPMDAKIMRPLSERIAVGLSVEETLSIIKDIAEALGYAHSQNVIHRDVKPLNILFSEAGNPILTDFGIAKVTNASISITGTGVALPSGITVFCSNTRSSLP